MRGEDVKSIRQALGRAIGKADTGPNSLSQAAFGRLLGLSAANARNTIERWEASEPTGPAAVALTYIAQGALDERMKQVVPEYVLGQQMGAGGGGREVVIRLWWPRFAAFVVEAEADLPAGIEWVWIAKGVERLAIAMWIDDPTVEGAPEPEHWLRRAAVLVEEESLEASDEFRPR